MTVLLAAARRAGRMTHSAPGPDRDRRRLPRGRRGRSSV